MRDNIPIAFYGLICPSLPSPAYLEHLWVEPAWIGRGFGSTLFKMACSYAADKRYKSVDLLADPNSEGFYSRHGAIKIDEVHGKVIDVKRILPKMSLSL